MPQETAFVYQDDFNSNSPNRYIWDGERWHKINNDQLNVHQALTDSLLAGDRVDAERLLHMTEQAEFYNWRRQSAEEIYKLIVALKKGIKFDSTYPRIYRARLESRAWIHDAVSNPEAFLALYRCNEQFAIELNGALVEVYKDLKKVDDPRLKDLQQRIRKLETWAETANLELPREPAAGEGQLRARVVKKADGSPMAGALVVTRNRATGKRYRKRSDSQGVALIKGLAAGKYRVGSRLKGFEDYSEPDWNIMKTGFSDINIYLKPSQPKSNVVVVVIDQKTGKKIEGARVSFTGPQVFHTRAGNGTSSIALHAGDRTVNADAYGYMGMVSTVWVDPSKSPTIKKKMVLPPSEQEKQKNPDETEMVFEAYEPDSLFTQTREPESAKNDACADLPKMPVMPGDLSRQEITQWRDVTIARLRKEGNARLDTIRAALKKMEGKEIEHSCHRCGYGGPHWWDGQGWTCSSASCGATVMTAGEYPTASGSYKKTREHYLSLINKVQQQAAAKLR